jgi:hypothetical protein
MVRLMDTDQIIDLTMGEKRLRGTELVERAKGRGQTDAALLGAASISLPDMTANDKMPEAMMHLIPELKNYKTGPSRNPHRVSEEKKWGQLQGRTLLDVLRLDASADVCGRTSISSLNYVCITCHIMMLFMEFESRCPEASHPLWAKAYEQPEPQLRRQKRLALVVAAMTNENDEAMKTFAAGFERLRIGALSCIFWDDLREEWDGKLERDDEEVSTDVCSIM